MTATISVVSPVVPGGSSAPHPNTGAAAAIAAVSANASSIARAMPLAANRASAEPASASAITPGNIRLSGLFSLPITPTAPLTQISSNETSSASAAPRR